MENRPTVGILGGGQLGRMMAEAGHRIAVPLVVLDPAGDKSPAGQLTRNAITGSFKEADKVMELANQCDVLTVEIEHVNTSVLKKLEKEGRQVYPSASTIERIQDKFIQKQVLAQHQVPLAEFRQLATIQEAKEAGKVYGYPYMLKSRVQAYDGRGNAVVPNEEGIQAAWTQLNGDNGQLYMEKWVPYEKELAVMIVCGKDEEMKTYPVVETIQKDSICHTVLAPAQVSQLVQQQAIDIAKQAMKCLGSRGIFGIEFFLTKDGQVLLNEIAPRPHNSGHYTIEACETDQFENHLRAVCGLPLGSTELKCGAAMMINILGDASGRPQVTYAPLDKALGVSGAGVHFYGKDGVRPGRKLAHLTVIAPTLHELFERVATIDKTYLEPYASSTLPQVGIIMGSDSDLPCMKAAAEVLEKFHIRYELTVVSAHRTPDRMFEYAKSASSRGIRVIIAGAGGAAHLPGMVAALTPLPVIGVPVKTSTLNGEDSLLSIVQMPRGVPVATVAIGNAMNAGLLAVRMLGLANSSHEDAMADFMAEQEAQVNAKIAKMAQIGWKEYLTRM